MGVSQVYGNQIVQVSGITRSTEPRSKFLLTVISKWVRGEPLGKGMYGRVYLAVNVSTSEMHAVKQVKAFWFQKCTMCHRVLDRPRNAQELAQKRVWSQS